jgi:hypothetical protein
LEVRGVEEEIGDREGGAEMAEKMNAHVNK